MSAQYDHLPLNITLSYGNVSFNLRPSANQAQNHLQSPRLLSSPRSSAQRRRSQGRSLISNSNADGSFSNAEQQPPILSIRRGKSELPSSGATTTSGAPPASPMRQHIIGRVRAIKEKIEVEERRQSGSSYRPATGLNGLRSPELKNSQAMNQLSGYFVDLHSFTGTLQIMPSMNPSVPSEETKGFNGSINTRTSDYMVKSSPGSDAKSPRKRIVNKSKRSDQSMKRSKTRSFTWIASNDSEVEIGMNEKSPSSQDQFMSDGIDSKKKFDFVDSVPDSENECKEGDSGPVNPASAEKSVKFSFGIGNSPCDFHTLPSSTNVTTRSSTKLTSSSASTSLPTNDSGRKVKSPPTPPQCISHTNDTPPKVNVDSAQTSKPRASLSTPPKLLQYAQQAMKQMRLGKESYNILGSDPVLSTAGSSARSWDAVTGDHGYSDSEGTELHRACASLDVARIHRVLETIDASDAMTADSKGKLPIHVLAENYDLIIDNSAECEDIADIFAQIMGPDKIVQALHGSSGWGPFVGIIGRWCNEFHKDMSCQLSGQLANSLHSTGENQARTRSTFTQQLPLFRAADRNNERMFQSSLFMKDREKAFFLPYSVSINDHVKWAIRVLSNLIDIYPDQTREAILTNITGTVPLFLKCIFLLNDSEDLNSLTEFSLIKHAAIDKRSINVWLIAMLTSTNREIQSRAVLFLKLLSKLTLTDLVATSQYRDKFSDSEVKRFVSLRRDTFDALYSMPGIFPAVLALGDKKIESLATTRVMRYITDRTIRRDKQFFRLICDFFYCVFLLLGFRLQVEFVFTENHRDGPPEYRDRSYWSLSTWALAFYFLVKDLLSLLSLYMTATKLAKRYCTSVYNFVDTAAVLILVVEGGPVSDDSISMRDGWAASLVTILLWLRLMGAFKILNQSFALYIYAVWEVIKEIKWFIVFLFMVTLMFSDAARAAVVVTGDCAQGGDYESTDFCGGVYYTVVRMYSILVGDVELDSFGSSSLMVAVFFFFSFFCIVILLNILIAIIIDSYERTKERSREIFGRAQVEYAAALIARKQFIKPKEVSDFHVASFVPHTLRKFLRLFYLVAHTCGLLLFEYGYTGAINYFKRIDSSQYEVSYNLILLYVVVGSIFNAYILSFGVITLLSWVDQISPSVGSKCIPVKRALEFGVSSFHRAMGFNSEQRLLDLAEGVIEN